MLLLLLHKHIKEFFLFRSVVVSALNKAKSLPPKKGSALFGSALLSAAEVGGGVEGWRGAGFAASLSLTGSAAVCCSSSPVSVERWKKKKRNEEEGRVYFLKTCCYKNENAVA